MRPPRPRPFGSARLARSSSARRPSHHAHQRGFTLLEVMAVLGMIAVLAGLATPSFVEMIRERRTMQEAGMFGDAFRTARARSLGRGAAVKVALGLSPSSASILEHVTNNTATSMPLASCRGLNEGCSAADCVGVDGCAVVGTPGDPCWKKVADVVGRPGATILTAAVTNDVGTIDANMDPAAVCFTPRGRTFFAVDAGGSDFEVLNGVVQLSVSRADDTTYAGTRTVLILANGQTRMGL